MFKTLTLAITAALIALVIIVVARTMMLSPAVKVAEGTLANSSVYSAEAIAERLSRAVQIKTISWGNRTHDNQAFADFSSFLQDNYPTAHTAMSREVVNGKSLLYRWKGTDPDSKPIGFIAHIDVVPVEAGTEKGWTRPPYSGARQDGAVWGRGTLDNKGQLITLMEAVEHLATAGFQPTRDIYLMFGHDEEVGGFDGAGTIADVLKQRGVHFAWTLDEGSALTKGIIPGFAQPLALISIAEKGSTTLRLTANAPGGHSATPGHDTAVSIAARAVVSISDNPYPLVLDQSMVAFLHAIATEMPFVQRMVLANLWLTGPMVKKQLAGKRVTAAALHTTTAPTIIRGGTKVNILPQSTIAMINYRIHPRDNAAAIKTRAEAIINDARITIEVVGAREPTAQSSTRSQGYHDIEQSITAVFGSIPVAPFLTLQGTDSRHYTTLADDNYRFAPFIYRSRDLSRIHGTDERTFVADLPRAAAFYEALIRAASDTR
ncbi:MAG: hypothetical protein COA84_08715 [Robiginitomaculum sp.]|nr:MAG: hypothetical protein COA84_08715 [Robiginitomaculum sp.]